VVGLVRWLTFGLAFLFLVVVADAANVRSFDFFSDFNDYRNITHTGHFMLTVTESSAHSNCGAGNDSTYYYSSDVWACNDEINLFNATLLSLYGRSGANLEDFP
jgi:hypothetical protein